MASAVVQRLASREVVTFLLVGGLGYVADVVAFNALLTAGPLAGRDPSYARVVAMALAMAVTWTGNRLLTWPDAERNGTREALLFVLFNLLGLGCSLGCLVVSHDVLGLTGRVADNVSANVVGLGLGTLLRFWSYRRFVFVTPERSRDAGGRPCPARSGG